MKKLNAFFQSLLIFCLLGSVLKINALNYNITFTGTGASNVVESVEVQNITKGTSVIVPAGNKLILTDIQTGIDFVKKDFSSLVVYPNPFKDHTLVTFFAKQDGNTQIEVVGLDGKKILTSNMYLKEGNHIYSLSLPAGAYFIKIQGVGFSYTTKSISQTISASKTEIIYKGLDHIKTLPQRVGAPLETIMIYSANDLLKLKGISGIYATIVTDLPIEDKNINFEFVACTDANGNNYPVTNIGGQIWMTENLRSTTYCSGGTIPQVSGMDNWYKLLTGAYVIYENNGSNEPIYGKIYNGHAALNPNNICPCEWHVPTDDEWTILINYLGGEEIAGYKLKITGTEFWDASNTSSNESGFSALPAGARSNLGTFGDLGNATYFMTSSVQTDPKYIWLRGIGNGAGIFRNESVKTFGGSVRCLKN